MFVHVSVFAQTQQFKKNDRVVFVGNSITHNGEYYHNVFLYYVTRFPGQPFTYFNCGISGDVTGGILRRMDDDILSHNPTHAVIMIGMNDVNRGLYGSHPITNVDTLRRREEAIEIYKIRLDSIVNIFMSKGIKVILQKPSIFDQTAVIKRPNNLGANDALKICADYIQILSDKYKLPVVDYWTILNNVNLNLQKKDSSATIIGPDRVHPQSPGHLIMAYQFLKTTVASQYVSRIVVDKDLKSSNQKSSNCTFLSVIKNKTSVIFSVKEKALPFPTAENQKQGIDIVPFNQELNMEMLTIMDLAKGHYKLMIDNAPIGTFTGEELSAGINLALYQNTPQFKQAWRVRDLLVGLWNDEASLRAIKLMELRPEYKQVPYKNNLDSIKAIIAPIYQERTNPVYMQWLEKYLFCKPLEKELINESEAIRKEAYQMAQPVEHMFKLERVL